MEDLILYRSAKNPAKKKKANRKAYYDARDKRKNSVKKKKSKKVPKKWKPPTTEEVQKGNFRTSDGTIIHYDAFKKSWRPTTSPPQNTPSANNGSVTHGYLNNSPPMEPSSTATPTNTQTNVTVAQLSEILLQMENTFRALVAQLE